MSLQDPDSEHCRLSLSIFACTRQLLGEADAIPHVTLRGVFQNVPGPLLCAGVSWGQQWCCHGAAPSLWRLL